MYYAGSFIAGILTDYFSYSGLMNIDENENEIKNVDQDNNKFFKKTEQIENENILSNYYRFFIIYIIYIYIFSVSRDFSWILSHSFTYLYCDETLRQR